MYRLLLLIIYFFVLWSVGVSGQQSISLTVKAACNMCTSRIETTSKTVKGVTSATYILEDHKLTVAVTRDFNKSDLIVALLMAGHDTEGFKAPDEVYQNLPGCCHYREETAENPVMEVQAVTPANDGGKIAIGVAGACGMCEERIENTALGVIGVVFADYDLETHNLTLEVDQGLFNRKELVDAILAAGHDADGLKASDDVYKNLPACCHYREGGDKKHPESALEKSKSLDGTVFEKDVKGKLVPLVGATIRWAATQIGTISDIDGKFRLPLTPKSNYLVVTYVGYDPDTVLIEKAGAVNIIIAETANVLDAVEITHKKRTTEISYLETVKVQQITSKELLKAACCSLAESFDTTPAIDASMTDAVTGTRKIEMLGLAGPYIQLTRENIPDVRGLAALRGLGFVPGPWIEGMQLNMGAGSVVNGFESITRQINVELKKPNNNTPAHFNAYASQAQRFEANAFLPHTINDQLSTATLLHLSSMNYRRDHNHDGFLDMPLGKQVSVVNRWDWTNNSDKEGQAGIKVTFMDNISGQKDFDPGTSVRTNIWGADIATNRAEFWVKRGVVNIDKPYKSLGIQLAGTYHDQKSQFGVRRYDGNQKSLYFNMIYQTIIGNTDHQIRTGSSFQYDDFNETVASTEYLRNEWVPGVFGEYTYKGSEKFSLLAGFRADYHNNFGLFFTPRLNLRYAPNESTVLRFAGGRGQKTANIFAENIGYFASNREIIIEGNDKTKTPYGLNAEVAWSAGLSLTKEFHISSRNILFSADINRIDFENQVVVNLDRTARSVIFSNLSGKSYSNSIQTQLEIEAANWLDIRVAYRYNDVRTSYDGTLLQKPLVSPHRAFLNLAIKPGRGWNIDYTINRLSSMRLPSTRDNDEQHRWPDQTPAYFLSNAQISKLWKNNFEVYLGGENIFNYRLKHPIIGAHSPFGPYFDSSLAWGPIMGINIYAGIRYTMK